MIDVTDDVLQELSRGGQEATACVSIYMPTHRRHPENQQDPIRFKNLAKSALEQVGRSEIFTPEAISLIESELANLAEDRAFWNHRTDGLAWFYREGKCQTFDLQQPADDLVVVADSLHIKPLIRATQSADRYHVLALTRNSAKLYTGTKDRLDEVHVAEVPGTIEEALGEELTEPHLSAASYGGSGQTMFHGHGSKDDEVDKDRDRFFRVISATIEKHWSNPSLLPLVLVALAEHHAHFRRFSQDRFLLEEGVPKDPASMKPDELRASVWEVIRQRFDRQVDEYVSRLGKAQADHKGSAIISDVAREAANGRVELLLLEEDAKVPGTVNWDTGEITENTLSDPRVDDVLDDLAEMVISRGGRVRILHAGSLQTASKVGAIYRY
jgi:hypothetical protein